MRKHRRIKVNIPLILVVAAAVISLFPLYWMIVGSLKDMSDLDQVAKNLLPTDFAIRNYIRLFQRNPVIRWFLNSLFISGLSTAVVIITNTMAGYALAKKQFRGRQIMFWCIIGTLMLPRQVLIVPMFLTMKELGLTGSYASLMLPAIGWPIGIFLMRQFMVSLPDDILESARMDGAGELRTFFKIVLPLSKPGVGALAIFTFIGVWNDYLWQLVAISEKTKMTIPIGIAGLQSEFVTDYGILFAGSAVAAIPMLTVFLMFQKHFTKGLTLGAVKG